MGYINIKPLKRLVKINNIKLVNTLDFNISQCETCDEANISYTIHKKSLNYELSNSNKVKYLEKVTSDIGGPITPRTYNK